MLRWRFGWLYPSPPLPFCLKELPDAEEVEQPIASADEFFGKVHRLTYHLYQPVYQVRCVVRLNVVAA